MPGRLPGLSNEADAVLLIVAIDDDRLREDFMNWPWGRVIGVGGSA